MHKITYNEKPGFAHPDVWKPVSATEYKSKGNSNFLSRKCFFSELRDIHVKLQFQFQVPKSELWDINVQL